MSDFLTFLYEGYIRPYLDRQNRDDGDTFRHALCEGDVDAVVAFAAAHAFLLGVRTGAGLRQSGAL